VTSRSNQRQRLGSNKVVYNRAAPQSCGIRVIRSLPVLDVRQFLVAKHSVAARFLQQ